MKRVKERILYDCKKTVHISTFLIKGLKIGTPEAGCDLCTASFQQQLLFFFSCGPLVSIFNHCLLPTTILNPSLINPSVTKSHASSSTFFPTSSLPFLVLVFLGYRFGVWIRAYRNRAPAGTEQKLGEGGVARAQNKKEKGDKGN